MTYLLGVDGGNTKTIALVADGSGRILGAGRSGCGDIYTGETQALAKIADAVREALATAGLERNALDAGGFSLAGADWPEDYEYLHSAMRDLGFGRQIVVVNDAIGALRAGADWGVSVVCGTGGATGAQSQDGRFWHTSFWQDGQTQGGMALQETALITINKSELGILSPTDLTPRILALYGAASVEALLHTLTRRHGDRPQPSGALSRTIQEVADTGDPVAVNLLRSYGEALGDYALAAARRVGIADQPFPLILAGGVLRHPAPLLAHSILGRVLEQAPRAQPGTSTRQPVEGAVVIAAEAAGITIDASFRRELAHTAPGDALFHSE
ncbi:N-acetylglucosamine kinase [Capsulimonas corticalis]|uniref:N-acetylglucosamine kinase n=1 Tax=Capsulimonas corticalis TaxID=2219043 RepID=A0A402D687_9BACT|nr:BadF/BadG/BcrA/BcrD ATPase family protein [Capsulimonas corticalis]BDI32047.1 N-acetylglucosamine kinase [Capsulimonas corticalis]